MIIGLGSREDLAHFARKSMGRDMTSLLLSEVRLSPEAPEARVERVLIDADQPALALTIDPAAVFPIDAFARHRSGRDGRRP
jgi:hypothetical protein